MAVFFYIKIYRAVGDVGVSGVEDFLDKFNLLNNVTASVGLDGRGENVEELHDVVVAGEVALHDFHRLELFEAGFFGDFVFALVGVVLKVADVGDVADVADFVAEGG